MIPNSSARYEYIRENLAGDIRRGIIHPTRAAIVAGILAGARVSPVIAREFADRFLDDVRRHADRVPDEEAVAAEAEESNLHPIAAPATPSKRRP
jgi:hypothetical protein